MTTSPVSHSPRAYSLGASALQAVEARMIFIAGADRASMDEVAAAIFDAGHVPVIEDWFSEPLASIPGPGGNAAWAPTRSGEESGDQILQPLTERLLSRCDAILRVGGPSAAADAMAGAGRARGLRVFFTVEDALEG